MSTQTTSMQENTIQPQPIDQHEPILHTALFLGMFFVFLGYVVEQFSLQGDASAGLMYQFIASFLLPFFIIMAGYMSNPMTMTLGPKAFLARIGTSRIIPYVVFSLLMLVSSIVLPGWFPAGGTGSLNNMIGGVMSTLIGTPVFDIPAWFIALLVSTECMHYFVGRLLTTKTRLIAVMVIFYLEGYWFNAAVQFIFQTYDWNLNFWFLSQTPMMYGFYLFGVFMRSTDYMQRNVSRRNILIAMGIGLICLLLASRLNTEPFHLLPSTVFLAGGTSNLFLLPFTALLGTALLILGAKLWNTSSPWTARLGKNTILLFCLNGIFYHYMNPLIAKWSVTLLGTAWWATGILSMAMAVFSMALCIPIVTLVARSFPQRIGRWEIVASVPDTIEQ
ncbi:acyltransferase family protein [Desulfovibrio inopinatus]|uniref:acyltransferase family protein n=1 Tax=Desulfovibrio inopinatus TaxID=102109 RepID=UPI00041921C2|nr:acyltransferase family protein [Desulfovibrio inopinatus]